MRRPGVRQAAAFALGCALAWPALSQGLFDDNEARRRVELLRQQVEASQKALEDRLGKLESSTGERSALLDRAQCAVLDRHGLLRAARLQKRDRRAAQAPRGVARQPEGA